MTSPDASTRSAPVRQNVVAANPLISFFLIAFAFSWLMFVLGPLTYFGVLELSPQLVGLVAILGLLGPSVAGFIVTGATEGRAGVGRLLRRCVLWRVGIQWYLFALVGLPLVMVLGTLVRPGALASFDASALPFSLAYLSAFVLILATGGPLFEEPGWRGTALPRLQRLHDPLVGGLILNDFVRGYVGGELFDRQTRNLQRAVVEGGSSDPPGPGKNSAGLGIFRYKTGCGTVWGHTGNYPGYTQFLAASPDGRRSVIVSANEQLSPVQGAPGVFEALRRAETLAVCPALAENRPNKDKEEKAVKKRHHDKANKGAKNKHHHHRIHAKGGNGHGLAQVGGVGARGGHALVGGLKASARR